MSLVVNHNLMSMNAARNLTSVFSKLGDSVSKLSSGLRVVSAADDAAGMAIRELMRSDIAVLDQGIRNASDAISMIQTAEGAMSVIDEKLIRMKELAEQAATGTYTTAQREIMNSEYQAMAAEIDRIANATDFNGVKLLDGSLAALHNGSGLKVHFGTGNSSSEDYYYVSVGDMRATQGSGLRVGNNDTYDTWTTNGLNLSSADNAFTDTAGVFGIQYSHNGTDWNTYGYVTVDATDDTLSSIVEEINQGAQSTATLNFATDGYADYLGETVTINGQEFTFTSGSATSYNTIEIGGMSDSDDIAREMAEAVNLNVANGSGDSSADAVATLSGSTITLYHEEFGTPSGDTTLQMSSGLSGGTTLSMSSSWTATTGTHLGAKAVWQDQFGYELQLKANQAGDNHQIRIIGPDGNVINNTASGVTLSAAGAPTLWTGAGANVADLSSIDDAAEWGQTVNGSGNTTWAAKDILTQSAAQEALAGLDGAINTKDEARASLGATQNRLENTITNLQIQAENLQAAESRISDVDVATEMTEFTSNNILAQSAVAMLAQANSLPSLALSLLGG